MSFQAGEVVVLKSGGPKMTVKFIEGAETVCSWFDERNATHERRFAAVQLKRWESERPLVPSRG